MRLPLEETEISFVSGYQLETASGLGMGLVSSSPLSAGTPLQAVYMMLHSP